MYKRSKNNIEEEKYTNDAASIFLFRLKTNTVNLNDRNRFKAEDVKCKICDYEIEDLVHFVVKCEALQNLRQKIFILQLPQEEDKEELATKVIFEIDGTMNNLDMMYQKKKY